MTVYAATVASISRTSSSTRATSSSCATSARAFPCLSRARPISRARQLTISAHNWYRWVNSDFPIFEPEVGAGAEPALQRVRATGEGQIPPPREMIATFRVVF